MKGEIKWGDGDITPNSPVVPKGNGTYALSASGESYERPGWYVSTYAVVDTLGNSGQVQIPVLVHRATLPDLVPKSLSWDRARGGVNFIYRVNGTAPSTSTTIDLDWVRIDGGKVQVLSGVLYSSPVSAGQRVGWYGPVHAPPWRVGTPPAGATHLRLRVDPGHRVAESNEWNNHFLLAVRPGDGKPADLVGSGIGYVVPRTALPIIPPNGPLPVNLDFTVEASVTNRGPGRAGHSIVRFYLSADRLIDPARDLLLFQLAVPELAPGQRYPIKVAGIRLPANLPLTYFGQVRLGMIVDANGAVWEANENNNRNVGDGIDRVAMQLFDPIVDHYSFGPFATKEAAEQYLANNKFAGEQLIGDQGWSLTLPYDPRVFSRFNGRMMPGVAFRIQAMPFFSLRRNAWAIDFQGTDGTFNPLNSRPVLGEPNPRTALALDKYYPGWFGYVLQYHLSF